MCLGVAFVMNSLHIDWLRVRGLAARLLLVAALLATVIPHARGEVLGNWDFSGGLLAALTGPATLSELSTKPYYPAFGGQPGIPAAEFGSPASFGITGPGGLEKTVLRVPNTAGYGPMGGLIAEFPRRINATATSLNRYTLVMDVLVRQAAYDEVFARGTRQYLSLFQTAPLSDGDLFIDVRDQAGLPGADRPLGIGGVYGGDVVADTWHRVALVATLDAPESEPRLTAYVDGQPASTLIWDDLLADGLASNDSVKLDLVDSTMPSGALQTDGRFSIATLGQITGQKPIATLSRKAVAGFKLRENMPIGCKVTLRRDRMFEFLDRLVTIALPRVRDFRGLRQTSFDGRGNYAMGLREQIVFPEIDYDKVDSVRGMDIVICTSARNDEEAKALLRHMNMPFAGETGGNS